MAAGATEATVQPDSSALHIAIVGAGIGGLACAIACRQANPPLQVTVLERVPEILTIGAGIHIPPNASRVLAGFGLVDKLKEAEGYQQEYFVLRRYENGKILVTKPMKTYMENKYGGEWIAIHRGDYQTVLLEEAERVGAKVMTNAEVRDIEQPADGRAILVLQDGRRIEADAVIGADGLWSRLREVVVGHPFPPEPTGDLAYRGTFTREHIKELNKLNNPRLDEILAQSDMQVWLGPGKHVAFYPLRNHTEWNMVLLVHDDLPDGVRTEQGSLEQMAANFEGWDPILTQMISCLRSALKWKLLHFEELDKWAKGTIVLLGDASHPTLPYQGQGAAMAVEDGAILGKLLAKLQTAGIRSNQSERNAQVTSLFNLFEDLRKARTKINVAGAVGTRHYYHLGDGEEQEDRDRQLASLEGMDWKGACSFNWGDAEYQASLLGFDVVEDAERKFDEWMYGTGDSVTTINGKL